MKKIFIFIAIGILLSTQLLRAEFKFFSVDSNPCESEIKEVIAAANKGNLEAILKHAHPKFSKHIGKFEIEPSKIEAIQILKVDSISPGREKRITMTTLICVSVEDGIKDYFAWYWYRDGEKKKFVNFPFRESGLPNYTVIPDFFTGSYGPISNKTE